MEILFRDAAEVAFDDWLPLWLGYVGNNEDALAPGLPRATWSRLARRDGLHGLVACGPTAPVGFAHFFFHPSTYHVRDACTLEDLFVAPAARGQGVARALIERVAGHARERGAPALHWKARAANAAANALYRRIATQMDVLSYRLAL